MPELAVIGLIGAAFSLMTGVVIYVLELRKYKRPEFLVLEKNLLLIGKRWNDLNKSIDDYTPDGKQAEVSRQTNTILTITGVAFLLSWLGFFFYLLIYISIKKLGRNRLSDKVFKSLLVQKELALSEVQSIVTELTPN
jgi:hypothetical protein